MHSLKTTFVFGTLLATSILSAGNAHAFAPARRIDPLTQAYLGTEGHEWVRCQTSGPFAAQSTYTAVADVFAEKTAIHFTEIIGQASNDSNCLSQGQNFYTIEEYSDLYYDGQDSVSLLTREISRSYAITFNQPYYVQTANNLAACGFTNWALNVRKQITTTAQVQKCLGLVTANIGQTLYEREKFDAQKNDISGLFTDTYTGVTPATRPVALDVQNPFLYVSRKQ